MAIVVVTAETAMMCSSRECIIHMAYKLCELIIRSIMYTCKSQNTETQKKSIVFIHVLLWSRLYVRCVKNFIKRIETSSS